MDDLHATYPYWSNAQLNKRNVKPIAPLKDSPTNAIKYKTENPTAMLLHRQSRYSRPNTSTLLILIWQSVLPPRGTEMYMQNTKTMLQLLKKFARLGVASLIRTQLDDILPSAIMLHAVF